MKYTYRGAIVLAVVAVMLIESGAALAASPVEICKALKDGNGTQQFSQKDVQALLDDPTIQDSGCGTPGVLPIVAGASSAGTAAPTHTGVLAASYTKSSAPAAAMVVRSSGLPFTGADLAIILVVGSIILASGIALRATTRPQGVGRRTN